MPNEVTEAETATIGDVPVGNDAAKGCYTPEFWQSMRHMVEFWQTLHQVKKIDKPFQFALRSECQEILAKRCSAMENNKFDADCILEILNKGLMVTALSNQPEEGWRDQHDFCLLALPIVVNAVMREAQKRTTDAQGVLDIIEESQRQVSLMVEQGSSGTLHRKLITIQQTHTATK